MAPDAAATVWLEVRVHADNNRRARSHKPSRFAPWRFGMGPAGLAKDWVKIEGNKQWRHDRNCGGEMVHCRHDLPPSGSTSFRRARGKAAPAGVAVWIWRKHQRPVDPTRN